MILMGFRYLGVHGMVPLFPILFSTYLFKYVQCITRKFSRVNNLLAETEYRENVFACSKTSSKRKKVNLTKYVYGMVGAFYNISSRVRRFTVLVACLYS